MRKKKSKLIKIICGVVAAASVVTAVPTLYADTLDDLKNKQEELKKEQEELEKKSQDLKNEKNITQEEIDKLEQQLKELLDKINELDRKASELTTKIFETNQKLEEQIAIQEKQYSEMKLRIQYMYENQNADVAESFITSDSMADLLNSVEYYQKIYDYDRSKLDEIEATRREIETLKNQLENELEEVKKAEEEMNQKRAEVTELVDQKEEYLASVNSDLVNNANRIASTQKELENNKDAIAEEEERIRQAELERQRRAAEEAAARLAAQRAASSSSSGGSYSSGSSGSGSSTRSYSSSSNVSSSYASGTAARVADYASRGISSHPATYGWCAAWVSGVYYMAGVTPPHGDAYDYWRKWGSSSTAAGTPIPIGSCVIFAPSSANGGYGHIGIYIGNNMIAHNGGGVRIQDIQTVANWTGGRYVGWVWTNGTPLN